jgi:putative ABC transport system substrate-binding protein
LEEVTMRLRPIGLIVILVLGMLVLSLGAKAEQTRKAVRIGVLSPYAPPSEAERQPSPILPLLDELRQVLREQGWVEGQNLTIEERHAAGQYERLPALAAELVQHPVDVILAVVTVAAQAAQHATSTIPIVFVYVSDPVGSGVVASLAQPGANVTGVALSPTWDILGKRLQLLKDAVPQMSRMAYLWNPANPANLVGRSAVEKAAHALEVSLQALAVRDPTELEGAFHAITDMQANGIYIAGDPVLDMQHSQIAQFALEHRMPTTSLSRHFVEVGGLMSYGIVFADIHRRAGALVDKILRGAKPADLPVEQPMKFELVINLKTAQALGLTIPPTLLFQADEIIR